MTKIKLMDFIESLRQNTNDWDDLCDCQLEDGEHQALCRTSLIRIDEENVDYEM